MKSTKAVSNLGLLREKVEFRRSQRLLNDAIANEISTRSAFIKKAMDKTVDIDEECGYPPTITVNDYKAMWDREGIFTRIVNIFPNETWKKKPEVLQTLDGDETPWEKTFKKLAKRHRIFSRLNTADQLSGIGTFGIVWIGIDDGRPSEMPVEGMDAKTGRTSRVPVAKNARKRRAVRNKGTRNEVPKRNLLFLRPLDESVVSVAEWDTDTKSPRFGNPTLYRVQINEDPNSMGSGGKTVTSPPDQQSKTVHWTRCIHLADNLTNSLVFGVPRGQDVFNRAIDVRKVLGGSGEMFWKGGFPGISFETQPASNGIQIAEIDRDERRKLRKQILAYQKGLQRYLTLTGMTAKSLAPQVADPTSNFEAEVKAMCISKNIPYRIFMGTEEAQLAGAQDKQAWNETIAQRQEDYADPCILTPLIERFMAMGIVDYLEEVFIQWPDLGTKNDADKADYADKVTKAIAAYIAGGVDQMITPVDYLSYIVGMDTDEAQAIVDGAEADMAEFDAPNDQFDGGPSAQRKDGEVDKQTSQDNIEIDRVREDKNKEADRKVKAKPAFPQRRAA